MIKKVIGIVVAVAAIVVIVIATLHGDKFSSLVFDQGEPASAVEAAAEADADMDATVVTPDSMSGRMMPGSVSGGMASDTTALTAPKPHAAYRDSVHTPAAVRR